MIEVYTGEPGACKTTALARKAKQCLVYNHSVFLKTGYRRQVFTNIEFSQEILLKYKDYIVYFSDLEELHKFSHCDIFIDEVSLYFDSQHWELLPRKVKKYLRLHRHYYVNIYGVAQDFKTIDPSFRRLVGKGHLYYFDRITGTSEPNPAKPPQYYPYVLSVRRRVRVKSYADESIEYQFTGFRPFLFTKKDFSIFNTHQEFEIQDIDQLSHIEKYCKTCGKVHVTHR